MSSLAGHAPARPCPSATRGCPADGRPADGRPADGRGQATRSSPTAPRHTGNGPRTRPRLRGCAEARLQLTRLPLEAVPTAGSAAWPRCRERHWWRGSRGRRAAPRLMLLAVGSAQESVLLALYSVRATETRWPLVHTNAFDMPRTTPLTGAPSPPPTGINRQARRCFSPRLRARRPPVLESAHHRSPESTPRLSPACLCLAVTSPYPFGDPYLAGDQNCPPFRRRPCPRLVFLVLASAASRLGRLSLGRLSPRPPLVRPPLASASAPAAPRLLEPRPPPRPTSSAAACPRIAAAAARQPPRTAPLEAISTASPASPASVPAAACSDYGPRRHRDRCSCPRRDCQPW